MYSGLPRATLDQVDNYKSLLQFIYEKPVPDASDRSAKRP